MRQRILFLTNPNNGARKEDVTLARFLSGHFDILVSHPIDCLPLLKMVDAVIIRNVWPTHEYSDNWKDIELALRESGLPIYNPLNGKGDSKGKDYLIELWKAGFPVIPSVDSISDIGKLATSNYYWIKPKDGCDGSGAGKCTATEIEKMSLRDYIIQPFVEFTSEPSFFFVDNVFSHAISMPNRLEDQGIALHTPTIDDLHFAQSFIDWNELPYGIQRVDALRTKTGDLILTEVEDLCPYLYLADIPFQDRQRFLNKIRNSMLSLIASSQLQSCF